MAERTYNGAVYRQSAPGQPWVKVGPVVVGTPNPKIGADIENIGSGIADREADNRRDDIRLAGELYSKGLRVGANGKPERIPGWKPLTTEKADGRSEKLGALDSQIRRVRDLYNSSVGKTKGVGGLMDYLPTERNKQFDAAGAGLAEIGLAAFRTPGVGSQSDAELKAFVQANRPSASDYDSVIEEKLRNLESRLGQAYKAVGLPYKSRAPQRKQQSRVIDFNDLPE